MKILSFDASSESGSIAFTVDGDFRGELSVASVGTHSEWLLPNIERFLDGLGVSLADIDLFAFTIGPGSFTGLRIGVTAVKGFSWALKKPCVGVSTLEALAMNVRYSAFRVCPVLDARKKEVYCALFRFHEGEIQRLSDDRALTVGKLLELVSEGNKKDPVIFLGDGIKQYGEEIKGTFKPSIMAPQCLWHVRASNVGEIAYKNRGVALKAEGVAPVYLRGSEAELKKGKT